MYLSNCFKLLICSLFGFVKKKKKFGARDLKSRGEAAANLLFEFCLPRATSPRDLKSRGQAAGNLLSDLFLRRATSPTTSSRVGRSRGALSCTKTLFWPIFFHSLLNLFSSIRFLSQIYTKKIWFSSFKFKLPPLQIKVNIT